MPEQAAASHAVKRTAVPAQLLHDLRTPLNQIIGYSEMLSEEPPAADEALKKDLEKIRTAGLRMLNLIEQNFAACGENNVATRNPHPEEERRRQPVQPEPVGSPGLVLVVDDDETNRDVLSRRLKRQGHTVVTAKSGQEALRLAREKAFDLVLLDIMMPDMDGYAVLGEMKADERLRHVPVIMISALGEVESVVRCIEAGAEDYLTKPFDPILLKARTNASLDRKRGRDRETALFAQLQENYSRLQSLEKLRDDMRNMIVHDLRTPLTGVIVGVEMLSKYGSLTDAQREMTAIAVSGGKTLLGMINDLLDVEKMESGITQLNYEQLSPAALVAGAVEQVSALAHEGQTAVVTDVPSTLPMFDGDENKLSRTLVNLIGNAVKFTPSGTVTVSASHEANDDSICFTIRDTGTGIPPEAFGRIFEKFGQLNSGSRVGTGLGLPFCKLAVEAHGGEITVESTQGKGSTFSFSIPREKRPRPNTAGDQTDRSGSETASWQPL